jgi:hypothetical protein
MLLIFAHASDPVARRLAAAWSPEARLIVPRDLSVRGWQHFPVGGGDDTIGLAAGAIRAADVNGVLVRIAAVGPADLPHIVEEDRNYVATEMTAFLSSLLTSLRCPVVNRPSASALMGPGWSPERWRAAATAAGMDTAGTGTGELVTVVGGTCIGATNRDIADRALNLARLAHVEFLPLRMTATGRFAQVEPWIDPPPQAVDALRALLAAPVECAP